jgi:hypothetical protein
MKASPPPSWGCLRAPFVVPAERRSVPRRLCDAVPNCRVGRSSAPDRPRTEEQRRERQARTTRRAIVHQEPRRGLCWGSLSQRAFITSARNLGLTTLGHLHCHGPLSQHRESRGHNPRTY